MKTIIIFLVLLSATALAQDKNQSCVEGIALKITESVKSLPLEWRGAGLFFDASNRFKDPFSKTDYGFGAGATLGYRQYYFRFEAIAPLAGDAWRYRIRLEYRIF